MFDIYLTNEVVPELGPDSFAVYGKIIAADMSDTFIASLIIWNAEQYLRQWKGALKRIVAGESKSALVVSYADPSMAEFLIWWPLYREGDAVYLQNQILLFDQLKSPWRPDMLEDYVPDRRATNDGGAMISEWTVQLRDIQGWLDNVSGI